MRYLYICYAMYLVTKLNLRDKIYTTLTHAYGNIPYA